MPREVILKCKFCGERFNHLIDRDGGRYPAYCYDHREKKYVQAVYRRKRADRKGIRERL